MADWDHDPLWPLQPHPDGSWDWEAFDAAFPDPGRDVALDLDDSSVTDPFLEHRPPPSPSPSPPRPRARPHATDPIIRRSATPPSHPRLPRFGHSPTAPVTARPLQVIQRDLSPYRRFTRQQHFDDIPDAPSDGPTPPYLAAAIPADTPDDFLTLGESSSDSEAAVMPPTTRHRAANRRASVVDLTTGMTPNSSDQEPQSARTGMKRAAESSIGRTAKRRGIGPAEDIEVLDLAEEAPSAEEELRQQQQRETIKAQQAAQESEVPQRIGQRQCIICMENYTDASVTSCGMYTGQAGRARDMLTVVFAGHFFCHECLTQALIAGEKNSDRGGGNCPVCRKALSRKKKGDIIPISFMKKSQFEKNQRKRRDLLA